MLVLVDIDENGINGAWDYETKEPVDLSLGIMVGPFLVDKSVFNEPSVVVNNVTNVDVNIVEETTVVENTLVLVEAPEPEPECLPCVLEERRSPGLWQRLWGN